MCRCGGNVDIGGCCLCMYWGQRIMGNLNAFHSSFIWTKTALKIVLKRKTKCLGISMRIHDSVPKWWLWTLEHFYTAWREYSDGRLNLYKDQWACQRKQIPVWQGKLRYLDYYELCVEEWSMRIWTNLFPVTFHCWISGNFELHQSSPVVRGNITYHLSTR